MVAKMMDADSRGCFTVKRAVHWQRTQMGCLNVACDEEMMGMHKLFGAQSWLLLTGINRCDEELLQPPQSFFKRFLKDDGSVSATLSVFFHTSGVVSVF